MKNYRMNILKKTTRVLNLLFKKHAPIYFLIAFFCITLQLDSTGQVLNRVFENRSNDPIILKVKGKVIATIPNRAHQTVQVNFKDRVDVEVPSNSKLKWYPIYINEMADRGKIKISPRQPYDQVPWSQRGGRASVIFFEQNVNGIHIKNYDPFVIYKSFESTRIFAGINPDCLDYEKYSDDEYLADGFKYNGPTPDATGERNSTLVMGQDNFKNYFSTGVEASIPMGTSGVNLDLGFNYSKNMEQNISESSFNYVSKESKGIYSIAIDDLKLIRLSDDFIEDVEMALQTGSAKKLIKKYGTHYPVSVDYGGYYRSFVSIEESSYRKAEEEGWDVSVGVSASMDQTEVKEIGGKNYDDETTTKSGGQAVGGKLKAAGGTSREVANLINNSQSNYIYVGGEGGFNGWTVNKGNAGAIGVQMAEIYNLIYPHIMKTAWTKTECDKARKLIEKEFLAVVNSVNSKPLSKVDKRIFKLKVNNFLKVDEIDDFNKRMKGNISVNVNGKNIPLWNSDTPMDMWDSGPNFPANKKWEVISQESDANGKFSPIILTFSGKMSEYDGVNDGYEVKMPFKGVNGAKNVNQKIELKSIKGKNEYKLRFRHDHWGKFVVDANITVTAAVGFADKFSSPDKQITSIRSAPTNSDFIASPKLIVTPAKIGKKLDVGSTKSSVAVTTPPSSQPQAQLYALIQIEDNLHHKALVSGDNANNRIYHQDANNRTNAKWEFKSTGDGYYHIIESKHNLALVAGDNANNRVYHQAPNGRDNAKWKIKAVGDGSFHITDKKHGKSLVAGTSYDGNVYHQTPQGRKNATWKLTVVGAETGIVPSEMSITRN